VPALGADARFLVGTDAANAFLQRLLDGEGRRPDAAIVPGMPVRELRLKALRRSGRCEVFLDGVSLADATGLRAPPSDALTLLVRSWGAVRVLSVRLEGGR
jgi:hypothetical protein